MRVGRSVTAALLVALLIVPAVPGAIQGEPVVDHEVQIVTDDPEEDVQGATTTETAWADIRNAWIHEAEGDLTFRIDVRELTGQPDDAIWEVGFTTNGTDYLARVLWDGSSYDGQVLADGNETEADTSPGPDGNALELEWHDYEDELPEMAVLEDTFAASDESTGLDVQQVNCHGHMRLDCAPDSDFGKVFPLGRTPAEGLNLSIDPTAVETFPDETLSFRVDVNNTARDLAGFEINLTLHVDHDDVLTSSLFGREISLDPGQSVNRTLEVTATDTATLGETYNVTVIAEPETGLNRTVNASITVVAPPPPPPDHQLDVTVEPSRKTAGRSAELTYNVTVTNTGARPDIVDLELTEGVEWAGLSGDELVLDSGESDTLTLTVRVPADADAGEVRHTVTATSRNDPSVSDSGSATTEVDLPGGFVNELDRTLHDVGLGGLVPVLVIVAIVVILVVYVVASWRRRGRIVDVDADFEPEDED